MNLSEEQFSIIVRMNKFDNFIFDFDGTLVDTQIDIKESLKKAIYSAKGTTIDISSIRIGPPLEEMIRSLLTIVSDNEIKEIVNSFRAIYSDCGFINTFCYLDIEKLLFELKKKGKQVFVATNKPGYLTKKIINKLNIHYFDDIATIDSVEGSSLSKKEMISLLIEKHSLIRSFTLMIGDTASDINAAHNNGVFSVGVGYGYERKEDLIKSRPDLYFDSVYQLRELLITK